MNLDETIPNSDELKKHGLGIMLVRRVLGKRKWFQGRVFSTGVAQLSTSGLP